MYNDRLNIFWLKDEETELRDKNNFAKVAYLIME